MTIAEEIQSRLAPLAATPDVPQIEIRKPKNNLLTKMLCACVLIMSVATVALVYTKKLEPKVVVQERPNVITTRSEAPGMLLDANRKIDKLQNDLNFYIERIWLLGVAHNENVRLAQQMGCCAPGSFIYFDEKWKLNKMPSGLTEEQKKEIQKHIK